VTFYSCGVYYGRWELTKGRLLVLAVVAVVHAVVDSAVHAQQLVAAGRTGLSTLGRQLVRAWATQPASTATRPPTCACWLGWVLTWSCTTDLAWAVPSATQACTTLCTRSPPSCCVHCGPTTC